mmetsp:Transcript_28408/g.51776  ORF Transcript_28408/g.51776 Transcript_28408/m.51776 type:complete len:162 (+) Transcript_28408:126-611(+)
MMTDKVNQSQSPSNNTQSSSVPRGDDSGDDGCYLPELVAYQGQGVLDNDLSSVGLQKDIPAVPVNNNIAASYSQLFLKRHKIVLLTFAGMMITFAVVISAMVASGTYSSNKGKDDRVRAETKGIVDATDSPTDAPSGMPSSIDSIFLVLQLFVLFNFLFHN